MGKTLSGRERAKVCIRYGVYPNAGWTPVPCYWCGRTTGKLSWLMSPRASVGWSSGWGLDFDHFIPSSLGGPNTADNTVLACTWCNRSRCNRGEPAPPGKWS